MVQSIYRAAWHGIVLDSVACSKGRRVLTVLPMFTKDGRLQRKPKLHIMDASWFRKSSLEISPKYADYAKDMLNRRGSLVEKRLLA